jgi:glycosyltransferase involved in cell wall biosynthesis
VICDERAVHVSYCHNPFRYAWNERHRTLAERNNPMSRAALSRLFRRWREWDWIAAQRVDRYVTNSRTTQARIKAYFGRDSRIIYPPVETDRFEPQPIGDHYLVLSELVSHKQIDVAIETFNRLRLPLIVIGSGPDWRRLRRLAGPTIRFVGRVRDGEAARLLASCRALVVTTGEEFGIAAVEAQAAGRPVVAVDAGGVRETVVDGRTGVLVPPGDRDALVRALRGDFGRFDGAEIRRHAQRFSREAFQERLADAVGDMTGRRGARRAG